MPSMQTRAGSSGPSHIAKVLGGIRRAIKSFTPMQQVPRETTSLAKPYGTKAVLQNNKSGLSRNVLRNVCKDYYK